MKNVMYGLVMLALLLVPVNAAHAWNGLQEGRVIIGQSFTLSSGETLTGDLVVLGGAVTVEKDATVEGSIVIIGGSLKLDGAADTDVVLIGAHVDLGEASVVSGDLVTVGGTITRAEGAQVKGDVVTNIPAPQINLPIIPTAPTPPALPRVDVKVNPLASVANIFFQALALAALAMLIVIFLQPQIERVSQAVVGQPFIAGSIGLLTVFLAPAVLVLMVVTLILIPVAAVAVIMLVLAWLFGIIALGQEVGERFAQSVHQTWAPVLTAGFGTFLLMIVVGSVGLLPCVGWLAPFLTGLVGIGGVVMTWFGSRPILLHHPVGTASVSPADQSPPPAS